MGHKLALARILTRALVRVHLSAESVTWNGEAQKTSRNRERGVSA